MAQPASMQLHLSPAVSAPFVHVGRPRLRALAKAGDHPSIHVPFSFPPYASFWIALSSFSITRAFLLGIYARRWIVHIQWESINCMLSTLRSLCPSIRRRRPAKFLLSWPRAPAAMEVSRRFSIVCRSRPVGTASGGSCPPSRADRDG
jgi:hypothetical protein